MVDGAGGYPEGKEQHTARILRRNRYGARYRRRDDDKFEIVVDDFYDMPFPGNLDLCCSPGLRRGVQVTSTPGSRLARAWTAANTRCNRAASMADSAALSLRRILFVRPFLQRSWDR